MTEQERSTRAVSADGRYSVRLHFLTSTWFVWEWWEEGLPVARIPDAAGVDAASVLAMWEKEQEGRDASE